MTTSKYKMLYIRDRTTNDKQIYIPNAMMINTFTHFNKSQFSWIKVWTTNQDLIKVPKVFKSTNENVCGWVMV